MTQSLSGGLGRKKAREVCKRFMLNSLRDIKLWFRPRPAILIGRSLFSECVNQARSVKFYTDYGVPDEMGARFEMLILHVILTLNALKGQGEAAAEVAQSLLDTFVQSLDDLLRQQGVGDLSVPKKIKPLVKVIYGRLKAWDELWVQGAEAGSRTDYITTTVFARADDEPPLPDSDRHAQFLSGYIETARQALQAQALIQGQLSWPQV
jgi:cytochrome b pre-mRNA-processing protein 3